MDRRALLASLNRPGTKWAAHFLATAAMSWRGRQLCVVRSAGDGFFVHGHRPRAIVRDDIMSDTPPSAQEAATLDIFCHEYVPRPGDVVLDIGAGLGEQTVTFSRLVGPSGLVVSVEAFPRTFRGLSMACDRNLLKNVTRLPFAVADKPGVTTIEDDTADGRGSNTARIGAGSIEVETTTIDLLVRDLHRVDLLKLNIEGAEQLAIRGMGKALGKVRHAVVSCHDFVLDQGFSVGDQSWFATYDTVRAFFLEAGFTLSPRRSRDDLPSLKYYVYARQ